jgi:hypothetical protein
MGDPRTPRMPMNRGDFMRMEQRCCTASGLSPVGHGPLTARRPGTGASRTPRAAPRKTPTAKAAAIRVSMSSLMSVAAGNSDEGTRGIVSIRAIVPLGTSGRHRADTPDWLSSRGELRNADACRGASLQRRNVHRPSGALGEWFAEHRNAVRTHHPIFGNENAPHSTDPHSVCRDTVPPRADRTAPFFSTLWLAG